MLCHTRLAESRPEPAQLTEFYFWVALRRSTWRRLHRDNGARVFTGVIEYPLLVATLPFFRGGRFNKSPRGLPRESPLRSAAIWIIFGASHLDLVAEAVAFAHVALVWVLFKLRKQPQRFAWSFAVLMIAYTIILPHYVEGANRIYAERNFFGVKRVLDEPATQLRKLLHGDTTHGIESTEAGRVGQPLSYYYPGGSVSDVMDVIRNRGTRSALPCSGAGRWDDGVIRGRNPSCDVFRNRSFD